MFELSNKRVFVAGHNGLAGSAIVRRLQGEGIELLTEDRAQLDLRRQADVEAFFTAYRPEVVVLAAARVGGIAANKDFPGDFLYDNLMIEAVIIEAARRSSVEKLLFLGSTCVYPRLAPQPMPEAALLTGPLEPTNEWYAVAKIAGIKLCQAYRRQHGCDFISAMPTNLYGVGDNYELGRSHVAAALIRRMHEAKVAGRSQVDVWGTGTPRREFLSSDDLADACVFLLRHYSEDAPINVGIGADISIAEFAAIVADVTGYTGTVSFDNTKPDGAPRKLVSTRKLDALGWRATTPLREGLVSAYTDFVQRFG